MNGLRVIAVGIAIALTNFAVVEAKHVVPDRARTFSCGTGAECLDGQSTGTPTGVVGTSASGYGVMGASGASTAVYGLSTSTSTGGAPGMYGYADGGSPGIIGYSTSGVGLYGIGNGGPGILGASTVEYDAGVKGQSYYGDGVDGFGGGNGDGLYGNTSGSGVGVYGSAPRVGGYFESTRSGGVGLQAVAEDASTDPLNAYNSANHTGFTVDAYGNGYFSGSVYTHQSPVIDQAARDGGRAGTFTVQSTRATLEETGTARLAGGEAAVRFDSGYARLLDFRRGYQVLLTPDGDTRGLYVAAKYEGGFIVREVEHGRSSLDFDYRVVAHPFGSRDERLPEIAFHAPDFSRTVPHEKRLPLPQLPHVKP